MSATITRHRKRKKLKADINVVPYIDVMLVLLIIFMVTAPLLNLGVDVDLPQSRAKPMQQQKDPVIVSVDEEGRYFLKVEDGTNEQIDATSLKAKIAAIVRQNPDAPVFVAAPGVTEYQTVIDTMVLLQSAGAPRVALMTQPPSNAR
ncbi:protein TolR [Arenimonas sp. MALMAid1274]|uniref:protein TolR n=1 Tax=Arenimonas sp. MALMAid1274 TaxID=3411630 RepID=UPI003BA19A32